MALGWTGFVVFRDVVAFTHLFIHSFICLSLSFLQKLAMPTSSSPFSANVVRNLDTSLVMSVRKLFNLSRAQKC